MQALTRHAFEFPVDAVFLWVDGSDTAWRQAKERARASLFGEAAPPVDADNTALFTDNDELRFALRALAAYAPWIRTVHLLTDRQKPSWLNTDAVHLVSHEEVFPPESVLPVFNSQAIEFCMYRIPGLAEHFLAFNDDFMLGRPITPEDFFLPDGSLRLWLAKRSKRYMHRLYARAGGKDAHASAVARSHLLVEARYGTRHPYVVRHHPKAMTRSAVESLWREFPEEIAATVRSQFRSTNEVLLSMLLPLHLLAEGHRAIRIVNGLRSALDVVTGGIAYMGASLGDGNMEQKMWGIRRFRPKTFCLNDACVATAKDRAAARAFLESLFPTPSVFER